MLVPYLPNPTTSGGQTRWYNIIKYLSKRHEITLFSLIKDEKEKRFIPELKKYCKKVKVFYRSRSPWSLRNIVLSIFTPFPLLVARNWSFEERKSLKEEIKAEDFDLIHTETFYVMPHLTKTEIPIVQVEQTIWHEVYKHHVLRNIPFFLRPLFMLDVYKILLLERYYWKRADMLVAVSEEDRKKIMELVPGVEVGIIPNGVDTSYYSGKKFAKDKPPRILYGVANFEWLQNREAAEVLIKKILPEIRKSIPEAKVWIVGRKIPKWILNWNKVSEVIATENIKDSREAYCRSTIMVAPIMGTGGTRLKILEAMASGLPVVSTESGVAGLKTTDGENVLIANDFSQMAKKAVLLLKNPSLAEKIGREGKRHVRRYFDWKVIVKLHDSIYKRLVEVRKNA